MREQLYNALNKIMRFSDAQVDAIMERITLRAVRRGEFVLMPPQVCQFSAFVVKGSFRMYKQTEEKDHTLNFFTEDSWIGEMESFVAQKPTQNSIRAMEKGEIGVLTLHSMHDLINNDQAYFQLFRIMQAWAVPSAHYTEVIDATPDERYQKLLQTHPDWILRFPQHHLASYLGISRETYSRAKRRHMAPHPNSVTGVTK